MWRGASRPIRVKMPPFREPSLAEGAGPDYLDHYSLADLQARSRRSHDGLTLAQSPGWEPRQEHHGAVRRHQISGDGCGSNPAETEVAGGDNARRTLDPKEPHRVSAMQEARRSRVAA